MNRLILIMCAAVIVFTSTTLHADDRGPYVSGHAGIVMLDDSSVTDNITGNVFDIDFDLGYDLGIAAGYDFGMFRIEGELGTIYNEVDKYDSIRASDGSFYTVTLMANSYFDIQINSPVTPFLFAGLGLARVSTDDISVNNIRIADDTDTAFAFQIGAGVSFVFWENVDLDIGYRYFQADDLELTDTTVEYSGHSVILGIRYWY